MKEWKFEVVSDEEMARLIKEASDYGQPGEDTQQKTFESKKNVLSLSKQTNEEDHQ